MPRNWEALAKSTEDEYEVADFQQALYQLVTQQCLYVRFMHQSVAYRLISRFRNEFKEATDLMGLNLFFVDRLNYCYVTQDIAKPQPMDIRETMFLLTLRHLYHVHATAGDLTPEEDAVITLVELQERYKALTGRDLDMKTKNIEQLLKVAQRQGLARDTRPEEGDVQPFAIAILPAIAEILSEYAIDRFGAALRARLPSNTEATERPAAEETD
jgi:hypothetical protein